MLGAATLGVLSSLLVSPCVTAPLVGALLYISTTGDALGGGLKLFALGLGMGAPLVLFAIGGGALLPKSGTWMVGVRKAFGVMLLAVSVWLLERVLPAPVTLALWGLLAVGGAIWLGALGSPSSPAGKGSPNYSVWHYWSTVSAPGSALCKVNPIRCDRWVSWTPKPYFRAALTPAGRPWIHQLLWMPLCCQQKCRPTTAIGLVRRLVHQLQSN